MALKRLLTALCCLYAASANSLVSEIAAFAIYDDVAFQNTALATLTENLGSAALFTPPGEIVQPDEVCYVDESGLRATFFVEHYGAEVREGRVTSTVTGVYLFANEDYETLVDAPWRRPDPCAAPVRQLSPCIGSLCIGDGLDKARTRLTNGQFFEFSNEWHFDAAAFE